MQCVAEGSGNVIFISRYVICMNLDRNVALMSYAIKTTTQKRSTLVSGGLWNRGGDTNLDRFYH